MKKVLDLLEMANVQGVQLDDRALNAVCGGEGNNITGVYYPIVEHPGEETDLNIDQALL